MIPQKQAEGKRHTSAPALTPNIRIDDCAAMSGFAMDEMHKMEQRDDGKNQSKNEQLTFAVYHLCEMIHALKRHYHKAYKGEIEP